MSEQFLFEIDGFCPICERQVIFRSENEWLRDYFGCNGCGSVPRERALMEVIKIQYPNFAQLSVHESSAVNRAASLKLKQECSKYSTSQYWPNVPLGELHEEYGDQCQNLEMLTFEDNSIDLFITQDVMEHVFDPEKAFKEIERVLKPGGAHIFTVPMINKCKQTEVWASFEDGLIVHHGEPEYHGNPIDDKGALVTMHWGYDLVQYISDKAKMPTTMITIDDLSKGIRADFIEVLVSKKL
jgi:SAM-dependent methyltransferase